jgi:hypothetical protein
MLALVDISTTWNTSELVRLGTLQPYMLLNKLYYIGRYILQYWPLSIASTGRYWPLLALAPFRPLPAFPFSPTSPTLRWPHIGVLFAPASPDDYTILSIDSLSPEC